MKDEERAAEEAGHDQRRIAADPAQGLEDHEGRDECDDGRDHQRADGDEKQNVAAGKRRRAKP
jgi:hypothetical protein